MDTRIARLPIGPRPLQALARLVAGAALCALVLAPAVAPAVARAATYDPLNIISYDTWRASSSMSTADIQAFLGAQTGPLGSYSCTDTITGPKPVMRSAAEIIWRSAQAWNVNPKVLLATLQKEQSLLTLSNSGNASRIVKAMGMGIFATSHNRYPGFANQVYNAARVFSTYEITYAWHPGMTKTVTAYKSVTATKTVGTAVVSYTKTVSYKKTITPANSCTFALYTYTPYYPQKGFWTHYTHWFEDPLAPPRLRPVYRFRDTGNGTYYYTSSEAKRYTLIRTSAKKWAPEGVAFTIDTSASANTVPLWQMYNNRTHKYEYTASTVRRAALLKTKPRQWYADFIVGYVSWDTSGTAPVYSLENKATHGTKLTSSASLRALLTGGHNPPYVYRRVAFRLGSFVPTSTPVGPAS